jgi:hypothetical protein
VTVPIKSYLAFPVRGRRDELVGALRALPACQVIPAVNCDLLVLVTDTPDEAAEEVLQAALAHLEPLEGLALVAGFGEANGARPPTSGARS